MINVYKHRRFNRWADSEKITDKRLKEAVNELREGLHEGNLGGGLYKKRISKDGMGKRSSYRTLLAFNENNRAVFIYGFSKNAKDNIEDKEKSILKALAKELLSMNKEDLKIMLNMGSLIEVK